jgi:hypothetical protein
MSKMFRIEMCFPVQHGIMFLHDTYDALDVPDDAGNSPVAKNPSCLAFLVLNEVDGHAKVTISDSEYVGKDKCFFRGAVNTKHSSISISDSTGFQYVSVPILGMSADISCFMSDEFNPDTVDIVIRNVKTS